MFPIKEFEKRFREILAQLDELREEAEELDELNANYEDALFVIECIEPEDDDRDEAFSDALDEFDDLLKEYRALQAEVPALGDAINRLSMTLQMAKMNLG